MKKNFGRQAESAQFLRLRELLGMTSAVTKVEILRNGKDSTSNISLHVVCTMKERQLKLV